MHHKHAGLTELFLYGLKSISIFIWAGMLESLWCYWLCVFKDGWDRRVTI